MDQGDAAGALTPREQMDRLQAADTAKYRANREIRRGGFRAPLRVWRPTTARFGFRAGDTPATAKRNGRATLLGDEPASTNE
jgi:hypothetical protein